MSEVPGVYGRLRAKRIREHGFVTEAQLREVTAVTTETHLLHQSKRQKRSMHVMTAQDIEALLNRRRWNPMGLASALFDRGCPTLISDIERWRRGEPPGPNLQTARVLRDLGAEGNRL